jgi:hypothetical protein
MAFDEWLYEQRQENKKNNFAAQYGRGVASFRNSVRGARADFFVIDDPIEPKYWYKIPTKEEQAMKQIFDVIAVRVDDKGQPTEILAGPTTILARNEESAKQTLAATPAANAAILAGDEVVLLARPFK